MITCWLYRRIPLGAVATSFLIYCWTYLLEVPDARSIPHYPLSVAVFGFSAFLELAVEPLWITAQYFLFIRLKVVSEGLAVLVKCILTIVMVIMFPEMGLISFCIAQVSKFDFITYERRIEC